MSSSPAPSNSSIYSNTPNVASISSLDASSCPSRPGAALAEARRPCNQCATLRSHASCRDAPHCHSRIMHVARDQDVDKIEGMARQHPGRGPDAGMPTREMPAASGAAPVRPISSGCTLPSPISRAPPSFRRRPAPIPRTIPTAVGCTAALDPSSTHPPTVGKDAHCATADGRP